MARPSRILVVEDDDGLRDTIGEVLRDERHDVRMARNGHEALEVLSSWQAELIVLDLMMPSMDGYEFRTRQLALGGEPPRLLVLSAARDVEAAAQRLRASAWLAKPFALSEMIAVVDDLIDRG